MASEDRAISVFDQLLAGGEQAKLLLSALAILSQHPEILKRRHTRLGRIDRKWHRLDIEQLPAMFKGQHHHRGADLVQKSSSGLIGRSAKAVLGLLLGQC